MAEYAQDFQSQSQSLLSYIQGKLANVVSWTALPGALNKIVASPTGFVWGFNSNGDIYVCKEPCDGRNWKQKSRPAGITGAPLDIAVDDQNVYLLFNTPPPPPPPTSASVETWKISIGDVGNPPGHVALTSEGVLVSSYMYGGDFGFDKVVSGVKSGGKFSVTLTDDANNTLTFPLASIIGRGFFHDIRGSADVRTKFSNAKTMSVTIVPTSAASSSSGSTSTSTTQLSFCMQPVDGTGSWSAPQAIPGTHVNPSINVSDQFIFVGSQGCSKPCTTNSWLPITQPSGSTGIAAASTGNTYAMGGQKIYQSSANGQGGWKEQAGLSGVIPLAVEGDNKFILGVTQASGRPVRCSSPYTDDDSCKIDPTVTYKPMPGVHTMSLNPRSYQTYVAAASSGSVGNLYQRVDPGSIDHSGALDQANQYITKMDSNVNSLGSATSNQNALIEVGKVKKAANSVIKKITDISEERQSTAHERENVARQIQTVGGPDSQWKMDVLQTVAITVAIVLLLYVIGGFVLSPIINMSIAIVGMLIGLGFAISFAVNKQ